MYSKEQYQYHHQSVEYEGSDYQATGRIKVDSKIDDGGLEWSQEGIVHRTSKRGQKY
jgi:hypothetical protein